MVDPTTRFAAVVQQPERSIPLDEAALLVAAHAYPGLDVAAELRRLDQLAERCWAPTLDALVTHLFVDEGFRGSRLRYYDPRNSFLNDVLDRRRGLPLTLSIVTMEVGRRIGVPLAGVGMPGHFLLRDRVDPEVFVDPFSGGSFLDRAGCEARFHEVLGPEAEFDESFLEPVGKRTIVTRLLANLQGLYVRAGDRQSLGWVQGLAERLPGAPLGTARPDQLLRTARRQRAHLN